MRLGTVAAGGFFLATPARAVGARGRGAPHPDIPRGAKLAGALKAARLVVYPNPANGSLQARMIDALLNRPEFAGVKKQVSSKGNGIAALARGDGDMALQLVCE